MWGLDFCTHPRKTIDMPEAKLIKAQYTYGDPEFDYGVMKVAVNSVQKLRGLTEWFQIVQPTLRPWLKVFDGLLKGVKPGKVFIYRSEETKVLWA